MMADYATAAYEAMSPTLLAAQPPTLPEKMRATEPGADWDTIYSHFESRLGMLRSWRWSWWAFWGILAAFFIPYRYSWLVTANRMWRGGNLNDQIINSTGLQAARTCAAGMWTGLCSPSRPWFKIGIALPWVTIDADGKAWLKDVENKLYTVFAQSNFYRQMAVAFRDEVVFGTSPVIVYEDAEDVIRLYVPCAGEYYLANGGRLSVNTLYREYTANVAEIVDFFTLESCPQQVRRLWEQGGASLQFEYVIAHAIEPNFALAKRGERGGKVQPVPSVFPIREFYWLKGTKTEQPLSKRGFRGQPFAAFRWSTVSNDAYGRSPCMDAIGDNKQVQQEDRRKAEFIEKGVRPPMRANPALKNEPASIMPGMITYTTEKEGFTPLFEVHPGWLTGIAADIEKVEKRIDSVLYKQLFMAITNMEGVQPRNELELTKRDLERLQELGPVITDNEEALDLIINRTLDILERRRLLKPKPQSLATVPLKITYVSILRLAQRSAESVAMKDCFTTGGELSAAAKAAGVPDPLRVLDLDKAFRHYCELNNLDPDVLRTEDEVKEQDQIRAKAQQQAQQPGEAMAGVQAAKTLSETALPGGNSALGAMLGQGGGV